jgi:hypothetical protein
LLKFRKAESSLDVHLLYGIRGTPDADDPEDVVEQVRKSIGDPRVTWAGGQAIEPASPIPCCAPIVRQSVQRKCGIHPSRPDACQSAFRQYFPTDVPGGRPIPFKDGLWLLESFGQLTLAPIEDKVNNLASTRNDTYLEHGYVRVEPDQAQRCFERSMMICQHLLGAEIGQLWRRFEMRF